MQPFLCHIEVPSSLKYGLREDMQLVVVSMQCDGDTQIAWYELIRQVGELCIVCELREGIGDEVGVDSART